VLGLILSLVLHFDVHHNHLKSPAQIASSPLSASNLLLRWVQSLSDVPPVSDVSNFTSDWRDGRVLYALVRVLDPAVLPAQPPDHPEICIRMAQDAACEHFGVPILLSPGHLAHPDCDNLSVITCVVADVQTRSG